MMKDIVVDLAPEDSEIIISLAYRREQLVKEFQKTIESIDKSMDRWLAILVKENNLPDSKSWEIKQKPDGVIQIVASKAEKQ